ncbi:MAG: hypothetical protein E7401_03230 [Ruminococcaceae bacterium]|nr:hypothetical protein [Oscillospiraceae bacterium]
MKKYLLLTLLVTCVFLISACNSSEKVDVLTEQVNAVNEIDFAECIEETKKELISENSKNTIFVKELFEGSSWNEPLFTISDDGSCLIACTSGSIGIDGIFKMNLKLGFSEALKNKMSTTRAIDGTQNDENDKFKVSWTYHPDNGLQVIYEKKY